MSIICGIGHFLIASDRGFASSLIGLGSNPVTRVRFQTFDSYSNIPLQQATMYLKQFEQLSLRYQSGVLEVLDQRKLPDEEIWLPSKTVQDMWQYIKQLSVRGAPLIGVAAALSLAVCAQEGTV